jgi:hypothetical protein
MEVEELLKYVDKLYATDESGDARLEEFFREKYPSSPVVAHLLEEFLVWAYGPAWRELGADPEVPKVRKLQQMRHWLVKWVNTYIEEFGDYASDEEIMAATDDQIIDDLMEFLENR